jgi:hypothetical protein
MGHCHSSAQAASSCGGVPFVLTTVVDFEVACGYPIPGRIDIKKTNIIIPGAFSALAARQLSRSVNSIIRRMAGASKI